jgi:hypothetical protein
MPNQKRDSKGRFDNGSFASSIRDNPKTSAAVAVGAAGVVAAGAYMWSHRDQVSKAFSNGMDRLSELKADRMRAGRSQEEIAEEALTLKETGRKSNSPVAEQKIRNPAAL